MSRLRTIDLLCQTLALLASFGSTAAARDWPTWLGDPSRSGRSSPCIVAGMLVYGPIERAFRKVRAAVESVSERAQGRRGWKPGDRPN